jgi:alpha-tubulin suppressor-like RCC1 family protein
VALLGLSACSDAVAPELTDSRLFVTASAGGEHTCGITVDGRLLCWGRNYWAQLGDGTTSDRRIPTPVAASTSFSAVSAGGAHTCALTPEGVAYCWGENGLGQLGIGSDEHEKAHPTLVDTEARFTSISAGRNHTAGGGVSRVLLVPR